MQRSIYCIFCGQKTKPNSTKCLTCHSELEEVIGLASLIEHSTLISREAVEKNGQIKIKETWAPRDSQSESQLYSRKEFSTFTFIFVLIGLMAAIWIGTDYFQGKDSDTGQKIVSKSQSTSENKVQKARELIASNLQRQDSCFTARTFNGDNEEYARNLCIARFPTSIEWALSKNHLKEQSCYNSRVFNGDNEINARSICLARYPIR